VQTGVTGSKPRRKPKKMGKFGIVVAHIDNLSSQQFRRSLAAAGILGKDGKLAKKYKSKTK
jgi:hypothetical protein